MLCRDIFIFFKWLVCADCNDGSIIMGEGLRSILINFNPLKLSSEFVVVFEQKNVAKVKKERER